MRNGRSESTEAKCFFTRLHRDKDAALDVTACLFIASLASGSGNDFIATVTQTITFNGSNQSIIDRVGSFALFVARRKKAVVDKICKSEDVDVKFGIDLSAAVHEDRVGVHLRFDLIRSVLDEQRDYGKKFAVAVVDTRQTDDWVKSGFEIVSEAVYPPTDPGDTTIRSDSSFPSFSVSFLAKIL